MALHINTFKNGLDLDTSINEYDNTHYPYALNLRLLVEEGTSSGTLSSMNDSEIILQVPVKTTFIKLLTIRNNLVILATKTNLTPYDDGVIYYIPFSELDSSINIEDYKKITKKFNFTADMPIIGRYETADVQKLYWIGSRSDKIHLNGLKEKKYFFSLNLAANNLDDIDIEKFKLVPEVILNAPTLTSTISGNLKVGTVQYAYCLFNINGAETSYSATTCQIPTSKSSLTDSDSNDFKGANIGEISTMGCSITISNIDTRFDMIRIVRLFYADQNSTPEINIVYEGTATSTIVFNDTGSNLGSISIDDYRYIPNIFSAKTLETKNNYLFAGNVTEETFDIDFDARAYRFNSYGICTLFKSDLTPEYYLNRNSPDWDSIPETADCINHYNLVELDDTRFRIPEYVCKYRLDGWPGQIGGTGKYVSYGFTARGRERDQSTTPLKVYTNNSTSPSGYHDLSNPIVLQDNLGYQRDEIYRFGIVLYDKYGRQSFVKWVGDIRFVSEEDGSFYALDDVGNWIRDIGLRFWLNSDAVAYLTNNGIVGWQVVRAERTYQEATVKDCGYIASFADDSEINKVRFYPVPVIAEYNGSTRVTKLVEYITPETNYNGNNVTTYNSLYTYKGNTPVWVARKNTKNNVVQAETLKYTGPNSEQFPIRFTIDKSLLFKYSNTKKDISLSSLDYSCLLQNKFTIGATYNNYTSRGTCLILKLSSAPTNYYSWKAVYARRRSYTYPYGGASYNSRTTTQYYPCSEIFTVDSLDKYVFQGDCYIGWFEHQRGIWYTDTADINNGHRYGCQTAFLLVETKINLKYTINPKWSQLDDGITGYYETSDWAGSNTYEYMAMQEKAGIHRITKDKDLFYTQDFNLYTYNPVYSQMNKSKVFISKPLNFVTNNSIDTRIYRTNKKINGELSDSWSKFPVNNMLDVDTAYGSLNKLLTFNNQLLYFQNNGVGVIPIEEREVVTSTSGNAINVGTGDVMTRYDYISTNSGCTTANSITNSTKGIYYIDEFNKKLCRLNGNSIEYLSDIQGVKSFMNIATYTNLNTLFNPTFNEIWFKLNNDVVIFNEYLNGFISFTDETFNNSTTYNSQVYTISTDGKYLKKLNVLDNYKSSELHLLINPDNIFTDRFDSLTISSLVDRNNIIQDKSFTQISLNNNYQEKSLNTFYPPARKRMRQFIYNSMRDTSTGERLIDTHLKVILKFTPQYSNERIKIFDVITNYTPINNR